MKWSSLLPANLPAELLSLMMVTDSMTAYLKRAAKESFTLNKLSQEWLPLGACGEEEYRLLNVEPSMPIECRVVVLSVDQRPKLCGVTLFPKSTLDNPRTQLADLGTRPLGEVLFADPTTRRESLSFADLNDADSSDQSRLAVRWWHQQGVAAGLFGRRSLFRIQGESLLVYEIVASPAPVPE